MEDKKSYEHRKWENEVFRRAAERAHDELQAHVTQVNEATIQSGQMALRMAMFVNGGAAIAVLGFLGAIAAKVGLRDVSALASTIVWFASGVAAAVVGMAFGYLTNYAHVCYAQSLEKKWDHPYIFDGATTKRWNIVANVLHVIAFLAGLVSLVCFIWGMIAVKDGIGQIPRPALPRATQSESPAPAN